MQLIKQIIIISTIIFYALSTNFTTIFISPNFTGCNITCAGTIDNPFDSLGTTLKMIKNQGVGDYELILMPGGVHYLFFSEYLPSTTNVYYNFTQTIKANGKTYFQPLQINNTNLEIKPLLCEDYPNYQGCLNQSDKITVFLKEENFNVISFNLLSIKNIILDGSESIYYYNMLANNLNSHNISLCLYSRILCCQDVDSNGYSRVYNDVICYQHNLALKNLYLPSQGLFLNLYPNPNYTGIPTFYVENSNFVNISLFQSTTLLVFSATLGTIDVKDCIFENNFFIQGTIAERYVNPITCAKVLKSVCYRNASIKNTIFNRYNMRNISNNIPDFYQNPDALSEGYALFSNTSALKAYNNNAGRRLFNWNQMNLTIDNCTFTKLFSAAHKNCYSGSYYNNRLLFMANTIDNPNKPDASFAESSAIMFYNFSGNFNLTNCKFENITGYGGPSLDFRNLGNDSNINIINNTFKDNFGFIYYSALSIRRTATRFEDSWACPNVTFINNTIKNNWGCQISWGTVIFMCSRTGNSYFLAMNTQANVIPQFYNTVNIIMDDLFTYPQIYVVNNTFEGNLASVSNGLVIHGFMDVVVENNTFTKNGVLVENFAISKLMSNPLLDPSAILSIQSGSYYYTASSPLFITRNLAIKIKDNIFSKNWAVYSGDTLIGSQISMINNFMLWNNSLLIGNIITDNTGIPSDIEQFINSTSIKSNSVTLPLITMSKYPGRYQFNWIPWPRDLGFYTNGTLIFKDNIIMNNKISLKYKDYDLYTNILSEIYEIDYMNPLTSFGFIRFITRQEMTFERRSIPDYYPWYLIFDNLTAYNNTMTSAGCFIGQIWFNYFFMQNSNFTNNTIYAYDLEDESNQTLKISPTTDYLTSNTTHGMICGYYDASYPRDLDISMTIQNTIFVNNSGIIINLRPYQNLSIAISNSTFFNNSCTDASLILHNLNNSLNAINNIFNYNNARFGSIMIRGQSNYTGIQNIFYYNNGFYSSTLFFENIYLLTSEINSIFDQNHINPTYLTYDDQTSLVGSPLYFLESKNIIINSCNFTNTSHYSGIFILITSDIQFLNCLFQDNQDFGSIGIGAVHYSSSIIFQNCLISNINFMNNKVFPQIPNFSPTLLQSISSTTIFRNCTIRDILASSKSNILKLQSSILEITQTFISNISKWGNSNYFFLVESSKVKLIDSFFYHSGNLFNAIVGVILINTTEFINNNDENDINILIKLQTSSLSILNSLYNWNSEQLENGIFISSFIGEIILYNFTLSNFISKRGYLISSNLGSINITNCNFKNNTFSNYGIAIYGLNIYNASIINTTFVGSTLTDGFIQLECNNGSFINLDNNKFEFKKLHPGISVHEATSIMISNHLIDLEDFSNKVDVENMPIDHIISLSDYQYLIYDSNIINNVVSQAGAVYLIGIQDSKATLINSTFYNNQASLGAGLTIDFIGELSTFNITNCSFLNNYAVNQTLIDKIHNKGTGGALYIHSKESYMNSTVTIQNSLFINNSADISGGAIYSDYTLPDIDLKTVRLKDNKAIYGPDLASVGIFLHPWTPKFKPIVHYNWKSYYKTLYKELILDNMISGLIKDDIGVVVLDIYGQVISTDNTSTITINANKTSSKVGNFLMTPDSVRAIQGIYNFNNTIFQYIPGATKNLKVLSTAVSRIPQQLINKGFDTTLANMITINFRNCSIGEIFQDNMCFECDAGFYSLDLIPNSIGPCKQCPSDIAYCFGSYKISPKPGYWKMNESSNIILKCPNLAACLGSSDLEIASCINCPCKVGYSGNLCNSCKEDYAKWGSESKCYQCSDPIYYMKFCFVVFCMIIIIAALIRNMTNCILTNAEMESSIYQMSVYKIFFNFCQGITVVTNNIVPWPNFAVEVLDGLGYFAFLPDRFLSIDCWIKEKDEYYGMGMFYLKQILTTSFTFIILLYILIFNIFPHIRSTKYQNRARMTGNIVTILIITIQPGFLKNSLIPLQCQNLYRYDQPEYYLVRYPEVQCWNSNHLKWLPLITMPIFVVWGILIPIFYAYILIKNKKMINNEEDFVNGRYLYLFIGYNDKYYYWEFIIMLRKILLFGSTAMLSTFSSYFAMLICFIIFSTALYLQIYCKPWRDLKLQKLETFSLISSQLIIISAIYFLSVDINLNYPTIATNVLLYGLLFSFLGIAIVTYLLSFSFMKKIVGSICFKFCGKQIFNERTGEPSNSENIELFDIGTPTDIKSPTNKRHHRASINILKAVFQPRLLDDFDSNFSSKTIIIEEQKAENEIDFIDNKKFQLSEDIIYKCKSFGANFN